MPEFQFLIQFFRKLTNNLSVKCIMLEDDYVTTRFQIAVIEKC